MGDQYSQRATGYVCQVCGGIAVVDMDGGEYLCAVHGIEVLMRIDLRATDPVMILDAPHASQFVGAGRPGTCLEWFSHHDRRP